VPNSAAIAASSTTPPAGTPAPLPKPARPKEIAIERGPSHSELFIISLREGKPSVENAEEGHYAAGAAHLANIAYRTGRRAAWEGTA
jgi:hypothetical protein